MLNTSEIVAKAEAMFDLFNDHFCAGEMADRRSRYLQMAGGAATAGAVYT